MDRHQKLQIDKACQETLAKYGEPQVAEAMKQLIRNDNPLYFTGRDNKENMDNLDKAELCNFMFESIVEGRLLKESRHYALLLGTNKRDIASMDFDEIELYLTKCYENGYVSELSSYIHQGINNSEKSTDNIINAFVHFRYNSHNLSPQELLDFEANTLEGAEISNTFSNILNYKTNSSTMRH